jgi:glycosyltransferase involved in cell wall biosynthesis
MFITAGKPSAGKTGMPHLGVITSNNHGLGTWERIGSLHREVAIYKKFVDLGWQVTFYTYDRTRKLPDIGFAANVCPQWPFLLPKKLSFLYRQLLPFLRYLKGRKTDIIITNQAHSCGAAILAGKLWKAKVVARCGYVYGESAEQLRKTGRQVRKKILQEKLIFEKAYHCTAPTKELADWVSINYGIKPSKITVIPNYVDTEQFRPDVTARKDFDIICIGRLESKKRYELLFEALRSTETKVHIIGNGNLRGKLSSLAKEKLPYARITPRIEHSLLPKYINASNMYVNLAEWEGHPKALIEAMACGCACIGAKSPGIENLIINGQTGILVSPEPHQIRCTIEMLLRDNNLREQLGKNAREYVEKYLSLDKVFEKYSNLLQEILST